MRNEKRVKITFWRLVLAAFLLAGLYATFVRFRYGLGRATALSDGFPWGLWVAFDVLCGVALAAGGFAITATVHIFNIEKFKPILRSTVLTAFLGYILVSLALLYDLGKPFNIWHPLVMWNPHSVMFEVAWCVMLYTAVLSLEFSPIVFEKLGLKRPLRVLRAVSVPIVIVGVILSTLHQSSLGTVFLIVPQKLHPLWYSQLLPLFFFVSAIIAGFAMVIFESFLSYRFMRRELEMSILTDLARVQVVLLAVYLTMRLQDLAARDALGHVFDLDQESVLFLLEIGVGCVVPLFLFALRFVRHNRTGLFVAAFMVVLGLVLNRMNVAITGMAASSGVNYFPSPIEFLVSIFIVSIGFVGFALVSRYFPVFEPALKK